MRELPQGRLNPKVKSVWRIRSLIGSGLLSLTLIIAALIAAIALRYQGAWPWLLFVVVLVLCVAYMVLRVIIIPNLAFSRWRYAVNQDEVDLVHGVIIRRRSIIPLVRVQHVDTKQGPILRAFGLASVSIATAAGAHEIPGLLLEEADALRDKVAVLARIAQEDI
ncbi:MAG: PH domain-containing protein [Coriobacteriales bacterium]|nr:PH domain-containing protein [Coriobacteriales bacterium]MBQ6585416.1 PH domain-containing protein [Coriobacteriales bacterium]